MMTVRASEWVSRMRTYWLKMTNAWEIFKWIGVGWKPLCESRRHGTRVSPSPRLMTPPALGRWKWTPDTRKSNNIQHITQNFSIDPSCSENSIVHLHNFGVSSSSLFQFTPQLLTASYAHGDYFSVCMYVRTLCLAGSSVS